MEPLILQTASEDAGKRLDAWLAEQTELTRSAVQKLMEEGRVTAAGKPLAKNTRLTGGETVSVELPEPEAVYGKYPHELSGGMLQRAMIAAAIVNRPKLLLLDEPTTALDVTIQAQILEMLKKLNRESGVSMLFISHNLNVVRKLCRRVAVMQKGVLVEEGETGQVFHHPRDPYTQKLIEAIPTRKRKEERP